MSAENFNIYDIYLSKPFSRMRNKTQLFSSLVDDHYHTRLLHSLEVEVISKKIARKLLKIGKIKESDIDMELLSSIALLHDIGHTPYGHIGERTLNKICSGKIDLEEVPNFDIIGVKCAFKHNINSAAILRKYFSKSKIKLAETLKENLVDGIIKHSKLSFQNGTDFGLAYVLGWLRNVNSIVTEDNNFKNIEGGIVFYADEFAQIGSDLLDLKNSKVADATGLRSTITNEDLQIDDKKDSVYLVDLMIKKFVVDLDIIKQGNNNYIFKNDKIMTIIDNFSIERKKIIENTDAIQNHDKSKEENIKVLYKFYFLNPEKANKNLLKDFYYRLLDLKYDFYPSEKSDTKSTMDMIKGIDPDSNSFQEDILKLWKEIKEEVDDSKNNKMTLRQENDYKQIYRCFIISVAIYISEMTDNYADDVYNDIINKKI